MNNKEYESVITVTDLFKIFKSKLKFLIIIGVIVAIIGGVFGAYNAYYNINYVADVSFYCTPNDSSNSLLYHMQSQTFAERLLLDENGLPSRETCKNPADYDAALALAKEYNKLRNEKEALYREFQNVDVTEVEHNYNVLNNQYKELLKRLEIYKTPQTDSIVNEDHLKMVKILEEKVDAAYDELQEYYLNVYEPKVTESIKLGDQIEEKSRQINLVYNDLADAYEKVLAPWRNDPEVQATVRKIMKNVSYEYTLLEEPIDENENTTEENEKEEIRNKAYITAKIKVAKDKEFVESVAEKLMMRAPVYIEQHIANRTNSVDVNCRVLSPYVIIEEEGNSIVISAAKMAVIAAAVAVILCYLLMVVVHIIRAIHQKDKAIDVDKSKPQKNSNQ